MPVTMPVFFARSLLVASAVALALVLACGDDDPALVVAETPVPSPTPNPPTLTSTPAPLPVRLPATGPIADSVTIRAALPPRAPDLDLAELIERLRPVEGQPQAQARVERPGGYSEGHRQSFWVFDLLRGGSYQKEATLEVVSEHAYWYVDDSIELSIDDLRKAAEAYETEVHPTLIASFGDAGRGLKDNAGSEAIRSPTRCVSHTD